ncbi:MAG TPA: methyl-accepting chemotaxis protein [Lachnospiraceae bacterium]|uniref:methyl-accepting chemotaxis protein n=1 Tax=Anaerosporobacter sp. TaxID=1872529 RepID=UPI000EC5D599|nr:methyl-accepting chemotaxis protein [Anaerosporobacter sp.]HAB62405.1 methyl-accepting chemotaxis protein [Lachnospiraceae bacterium]
MSKNKESKGNKENKGNKTIGIKSIKLKLILVIIPLVIIATFIMLSITYKRSREIIMEYADQLVQSLTISNTHEIENWSQDIISGLNQVKNTLDNIQLSDDELMEYLKTTMNKNESYKSGVYIGLSDNRLVEPSGWIPDEDYVVTERDWYIEGLKNEEKFNFGEAYQDKNTGEYIVSATAKLRSVENVEGVASADVSLKTISEMVSTKSILNTGKLFLVDSSNNKIIAIGDDSLINTSFTMENPNELIQTIVKTVNINENSVKELTSNGISYSVCIQAINKTPWKLIGYVSHEEVLSSLNDLQKIVIELFIVAVILIIILIERVVHFIIKPVKELNHTINSITEGDFTVEVKVQGNDEIATMSSSMQRFIETMHNTIQEVGKMSESLDHQAKNSSRVALELYDSAETQSNAMTELNQTVDELAMAVSEVAENATELSIVVTEASQDGKEASIKMKDTVAISEKGKADMGQVSMAMTNLNDSIEQLIKSVEEVDESSEKINNIVLLIGEIANQTNLLSLNAAIEAARAGEAGKGFAVVASEIRKLAETSQESVNNITELTSNIASLVNNTIQKTQESADNIKQSIDLVGTAENTFGDIYNTVNETNNIVQKMMEKVTKVDEVATSVAAITEEQSAAAEEILATSENLSNHAKKVTENSHTVDEDAAKLLETAENLNTSMKMFKI